MYKVLDLLGLVRRINNFRNHGSSHTIVRVFVNPRTDIHGGAQSVVS